jgi:bacterioferritin-associated ferredoxin
MCYLQTGVIEYNPNKAYSGANTWTKVHAHYGYSPSCGKCQIEIRKAIENHKVLDSSPESLSCSAAIA